MDNCWAGPNRRGVGIPYSLALNKRSRGGDCASYQSVKGSGLKFAAVTKDSIYRSKVLTVHQADVSGKALSSKTRT
jgi:hypothetical protein